jgi:tetratricopeptide (TPR) repeat protein
VGGEPVAVSIVVPVYNRTIYLKETLQSVLSQSRADWAVLVVDDGSDEDVQQCVSALGDARIRCLRQSNQGNAAARNHGIKHAAGRYASCLDSDDVWHPDFLRICVERLDACPSTDVVYTQFNLIDNRSKCLRSTAGSAPPHASIMESLLMGYPILPSSAVVRTCRFGDWGAYTRGLDDWELWLRWAAQGCRFEFVDEPLLSYRIHDQNYSSAYAVRRSVHFSMLDKFYRQERLPDQAHRLRERAYGTQHFRFSALALQVGDTSSAVLDFVAAVRRHPAFLADLDFYTQLACAHQGRINAGSSQGFRLNAAEETLLQCLDAFFSEEDMPRATRRLKGQSYGYAHFALARAAYGLARDMRAARAALLRALAAYPAIAVRSDWVTWMLRAILGQARVHSLKQWVLHKQGNRAPG